MKKAITFLVWAFLTACLFLTNPLSAQQGAVSGSISDVAGAPVVGAYVGATRLSATGNHTHSDEFGRFRLANISAGDTLLITLLGYAPERVVVNQPNRKLNVRLNEVTFDLGAITVNQSEGAASLISTIDQKVIPVRNSQELLRRVPGLIIGQHAGGGKAEQLFLRGFDIDHGTDVALSVDGIPVNMVSHAHGQGYADLHFVIPETVEGIEFGKGPYAADRGNFATAGYVALNTKKRLESSSLTLEGGAFNYQRAVGMFRLLDTLNQQAYVAAEYVSFDGPFDSPQQFTRNNIMGRYSKLLNNGVGLSLIASHFSSSWDASGQIPQRAVDAGTIGRFGAIDDTEGGNTSRTNLSLTTTHPINNRSFLKNQFYFSQYDFELFSNFTFFLEDPENADQIRQTEDRNLFGFQSSYNQRILSKGSEINLEAGVGLRADQVNDIGLSRTANRTTLLEQIQLGDVDEKNYFGFAAVTIEKGDWTIKPALRYDYFRFNYVDRLATTYENQFNQKGAFSPKLSVYYDGIQGVKLFAKTGFGFHANDSRVVLSQDNREILPQAFGTDIGAVFKPLKRLVANVALWTLYLEQEFVYVGDAGIVEPSGRTRRRGVDLGLRYQLNDWLFADADATYTHARSIDDAEGENLIPLAPIWTVTGGLSLRKDNYRAGLRVRHLGDRPANEDNSIVATGYTVVDLNANYDIGNITLGFTVENLFDVDWNETQFATESRLQNEAAPVEEIHFTPGTPLFARGTITYRF